MASGRRLAVWDDLQVTDVLADPVNAALDGPHIRFREASGRIRRYQPDVSVFYGHPRELTDDDYSHVALLAGDTKIAVLRDRAMPLPAGWSVRAGSGRSAAHAGRLTRDDRSRRANQAGTVSSSNHRARDLPRYPRRRRFAHRDGRRADATDWVHGNQCSVHRPRSTWTRPGVAPHPRDRARHPRSRRNTVPPHVERQSGSEPLHRDGFQADAVSPPRDRPDSLRRDPPGAGSH